MQAQNEGPFLELLILRDVTVQAGRGAVAWGEAGHSRRLGLRAGCTRLLGPRLLPLAVVPKPRGIRAERLAWGWGAALVGRLWPCSSVSPGG